MPSNLPRYTLRADKEILDKIYSIAKKNERSMNQEILYVLKQHINKYEADNGKIDIKNLNVIDNNNGTINM